MFVSLNQTAPIVANAGLTQNINVSDAANLSTTANNTALPSQGGTSSSGDNSGWIILIALVALVFFVLK